MKTVNRIAGWFAQAARSINYISCAAIVVMMLLTCSDVVLRLFRKPIPGVYELVGYLGAITVALALAYTSVEKGHIAVELLTERLPGKLKSFIEGSGTFIGAVFFALASWQSALYASELKEGGEVSLTLEIPLYPFAYAIALGCMILTLVLIIDGVRDFRRVLSR